MYSDKYVCVRVFFLHSNKREGKLHNIPTKVKVYALIVWKKIGRDDDDEDKINVLCLIHDSTVNSFYNNKHQEVSLADIFSLVSVGSKA